MPPFVGTARIVLGFGRRGYGFPKLVVGSLLFFQSFASLAFFITKIEGLALGVTIDALCHKSMGGIQDTFDLGFSITRFAEGDIALGEFKVRENAVGIRPLFKQIVVFKEVIVAKCRVSKHAC